MRSLNNFIGVILTALMLKECSTLQRERKMCPYYILLFSLICLHPKMKSPNAVVPPCEAVAFLLNIWFNIILYATHLTVEVILFSVLVVFISTDSFFLVSWLELFIFVGISSSQIYLTTLICRQFCFILHPLSNYSNLEFFFFHWTVHKDSKVFF